MPYIALVDNLELELADIEAIRAALREGRITGETWIADIDQEADWETVEEKFPDLIEPQ